MPRERAVNQLSLEGVIIDRFDNMKLAAEKTGTDYTSICQCCRDNNKTANGFKWEYENSKFIEQINSKADPLDKLLDFL